MLPSFFLVIGYFFQHTTAFSFSAYDLGLLGLYPTQHYESFPLEPPSVQITTWSPECEVEGSVLLISPRGVYVPKPGPVILDTRGNLIWMEEKFGQAMNLQVQTYEDEDFITFWSGSSHGPHSNGSYYMLNSAYEVIHQVHAHGYNLSGDLHEFHITPQNTALITIYTDTLLDCTSLGLAGTSCWIDDCLFQEISISTGALLFQWRASTHIPISTSYKPFDLKAGDGSTPEKAYDFFHMNSIEKTPGGDYIISARHMHALYLISGTTGEIIWSLGGRNSSFEDLSRGQASNFMWQHHARLHGNNTLSLFDNGGNIVFDKFKHSSRGLLLSLSPNALTTSPTPNNLTISLLHDYVHPTHHLAISQGSMQVLPSTTSDESLGNVLIGWGNTPSLTEFSPTGTTVLCDMHFGPAITYEIFDAGWVKSYRAFKRPWVGRPSTAPDVAIQGGRLYVSWNGATEVKGWALQGADAGGAETRGINGRGKDNEERGEGVGKTREVEEDDFINLDAKEKDGFETSFDLKDEMLNALIRVVALDKNGKRLGVSAVVDSTPVPSTLSVPMISIIVFAITVALAVFLAWKYRAALSDRCRRTYGSLSSRGWIWQRRRQEYELLDAGERGDGARAGGIRDRQWRDVDERNVERRRQVGWDDIDERDRERNDVEDGGGVESENEVHQGLLAYIRRGALFKGRRLGEGGDRRRLGESGRESEKGATTEEV